MSKKTFSVDAETNGLYGQPFSIAALILTRQGHESDRFVARCPIAGPVDPFVVKSVLPQMTDIEETHASYETMLADFAEFYLRYRKKSYVVAQVPYPVETGFFRTMVETGLIDELQGPYPFYDTASMLRDRMGSSSIQRLFKEHPELEQQANGLYEGQVHNPLRDCATAGVVFNYLRITAAAARAE